MIKVTGLTKRYARNIAVDNISFEVEKGQIVGFLGPNGAGKTTTMRVLTCFLPPTAGTASVAGFDVLDQPLEVKRHIGYLPEAPPVYPEMEVSEYLSFVGSLKGLKGADLAKRKLIRGLAGEHTIILSTHILPEVEQTCDHAIIINKGKVVAKDSVTNLQNRVRGAESVVIAVEGRDGTLESPDVQRRLESVAGVSRVVPRDHHGNLLTFEVESLKERPIRGDLARAVVEAGWNLNELRSAAMTLEEVFLELTGADATTAAAEPAGGEQ